MTRALAPLRYSVRFLRRFVRQVGSDLRVLRRPDDPRWGRVARIWGGLGCFGLFICVLHFGGLRYRVYTNVWWWDLLTHTLGGVGVAGIGYYGGYRGSTRSAEVLALVPILLFVGAGFEVYEYLFKSFWWSWTPAYYAMDTAIDIVLDVAGAVIVVAGHACWLWLRRREVTPGPTGLPED